MRERVCVFTPPISYAKSYYDILDFAYENGIRNVELLNRYELSQPDKAFAQKLKRYADEKGIKFPCFSVGVNLVAEDFKSQTELAKRYADIAVILEAPYLHHTIAVDISNPEIMRKNKEIYFERGITATRNIYDYAESLGIRTVCEGQGYLFNGIKGIEYLLNNVERNIGIIADVGSIMFAEEKAEDFICKFLEKIVHIHIDDYIFTAKGKREKNIGEYSTICGNYIMECALGCGEVNFKKIFDILKKSEYKGMFSIESSSMGVDEEKSFINNLLFLESYIRLLNK